MLTPPRAHQQAPAPKLPARKDRIILHFDYDCFYASVYENENPSLKSLPLGIKQKSILATCNYNARARGVKKLMLISEALKLCPELVIINGEDLTKFRSVSKQLLAFLRSHSWNKRVERLGLDEVFLDVSDIISYNEQILNRSALNTSFFHLSEQDPEKGFPFDATSFFGCTYPRAKEFHDRDYGNSLFTQLLLASHLAGYLRHKLENDFGYTSTCGVATNKVLAKLAGTQNKPKNQTTLLALQDEVLQDFMNPYQIRKIPGIGFRISHLLDDYIRARVTTPVPHDDEHSAKITVCDVLEHSGLSPGVLERVLGGPGTERGIGQRTWHLLHGIDYSEVKEASDVPTQISIEDTYMSNPLNSPEDLMRELRSLTTSLVRRMHIELLEGDDALDNAEPQRWLAHPKTLRLSTRTRSKPGSDPHPFSRNSRSQPLPNFVFSLKDNIESIVGRLVSDAILPLFRRLHSERQGWNLTLINICVSNMVLIGSEDGTGGGRDISIMFKTQDAKLKEFTVYADSSVGALNNPKDDMKDGMEGFAVDEAVDSSDTEMVEWEEDDEDTQLCPVCGHGIPTFALPAHERFHEVDD